VIGIVFATRKEAAPLLARLPSVEPLPGRLPLFKAGGGRLTEFVLILGGIGKVAAALATAYLILEHGVQRLINVGLCGSLTHTSKGKAQVGVLYRISKACEGDLKPFNRQAAPVSLDQESFSGLPTGRLVTCDTPVFDRKRKKELALLGDLVDMEGAAVARVAESFGVPCSLLKGVSDFADTCGRDHLKANLSMVSEKIALTLLAELTRP
jgi:adenosylhomocysteine nucleosidase